MHYIMYIDGALRLSSSSHGRVEVYYNGEFGTVCDNSFGPIEADLTCRQIGFASATFYGTVDELGYICDCKHTHYRHIMHRHTHSCLAPDKKHCHIHVNLTYLYKHSELKLFAIELSVSHHWLPKILFEMILKNLNFRFAFCHDYTICGHSL